MASKIRRTVEQPHTIRPWANQQPRIACAGSALTQKVVPRSFPKAARGAAGGDTVPDGTAYPAEGVLVLWRGSIFPGRSARRAKARIQPNARSRRLFERGGQDGESRGWRFPEGARGHLQPLPHLQPRPGAPRILARPRAAPSAARRPLSFVEGGARRRRTRRRIEVRLSYAVQIVRLGCSLLVAVDAAKTPGGHADAAGGPGRRESGRRARRLRGDPRGIVDSARGRSAPSCMPGSHVPGEVGVLRARGWRASSPKAG